MNYVPAMRLGKDPRLQSAALGWQDLIRGTHDGATAINTTAGVQQLNSPAQLMGRALTAGVYYFALLVSGCGSVDVTLKLTALTGGTTVPTMQLYKTLYDNQTEKLNASGASAAITVQNVTNGGAAITTTVPSLTGEQVVLLKITVPAGETATFGVAEYSAR